jgi:hypothetical protein
MTQLSPAAQAVLDAINKELDEAPWDVSFLASVSAAAAIRVVTDYAAPELPHSELDDPEILKGIWGERRACRAELLAIATELESQ